MLNPPSSTLQYARFYDLYASGFARDLPIYLDVAAKYAPPVLEIGCGTGRLLRALALEGHEAVGVDVSRDMLAVARDRLGAAGHRIRLAHHDFRARPLPERFHAVLVTLHAFNYLIEIEEQRLFLRHLRQSMIGPARVMFDLALPLSMVRPEFSGQWRLIEREVGGTRIRVRDRREMLTPLLERRTQLFSVDAGPEVEMVTHRRYVTPASLRDLLAEAGFEHIVWFENYDPSTASPIQVRDRPSGPFMVAAEL